MLGLSYFYVLIYSVSFWKCGYSCVLVWFNATIMNEWNSFCPEYKECLCVHCKQAFRGLKPVNKKTKTALKIE